jgi:hypothetical protein
VDATVHFPPLKLTLQHVGNCTYLRDNLSHLLKRTVRSEEQLSHNIAVVISFAVHQHAEIYCNARHGGVLSCRSRTLNLPRAQ